MVSCLFLSYQERFSQQGLTESQYAELEDKVALVLEELEQKGEERPLSSDAER
jgi:hypothetical protein